MQMGTWNWGWKGEWKQLQTGLGSLGGYGDYLGYALFGGILDGIIVANIGINRTLARTCHNRGSPSQALIPLVGLGGEGVAMRPVPQAGSSHVLSAVCLPLGDRHLQTAG